MRIIKILAILASLAAAGGLVDAPASWAKGGGGHSNAGGSMRGLDRANQVAGSHGAAGRADAQAHHDAAQPNSHSNKGGAVRGLNRANDVAGTHGASGRSNALSHQSQSHGRSH
jgi:hypothetical protein